LQPGVGGLEFGNRVEAAVRAGPLHRGAGHSAWPWNQRSHPDQIVRRCSHREHPADSRSPSVPHFA